MVVTFDLDVVTFMMVRVVIPMWQMGKGSHGRDHKSNVIVVMVVVAVLTMIDHGHGGAVVT